MRHLDALAKAGEEHVVFAHHIAAAQGGETDLPWLAPPEMPSRARTASFSRLAPRPRAAAA